MKSKQPLLPEPDAYDSEGRPLYYHAPLSGPPRQSTSLVSVKPGAYEGHNFDPRLRAQYANEPDFIHARRELEPRVSGISEELQRKHDESVKKYPFLNLSEGEFVILRIKRHPIGLFMPIIIAVLAVILLTAMALLVPDFYAISGFADTSVTTMPAQQIIIALLLVLALLSVLFGVAAVWIYQKNQFFLTNESVIQEIQHGLFWHREQTVSLGSIEDASFKRRGLLQHMLDYGTMRLSTEGQETTYIFAFVENPKKQIATVSNAVEAFKNGRPVTG